MAIGITVSGNAIAGFEIDLTDADQSERVRVVRIDQSGHYSEAAVRDIDMVEPTGDTMSVTDYEAPLNTALTYRAEVYDLSDLETPVATDTSDQVGTHVPLGFAVITDVSDPDARVAGGIIDLSTWSYRGKVLGSFDVLGRRNPVLITDVLGGRTGTIVATNLNLFEIDFDGLGPYPAYEAVDAQWSSIFNSGSTLLFRSDWTASAFDDCYFKVQGLEVARLTRILGTEVVPIRQYTIDFVEVDRPITRAVNLELATWQTILANNADWQEVLDDHDSWLSVLANPND